MEWQVSCVHIKLTVRSKYLEPGSLTLTHLFVFLHVPDLHLTLQVPEAGQHQDVTLRTDRSDQRSEVTVRLGPESPDKQSI